MWQERNARADYSLAQMTSATSHSHIKANDIPMSVSTCLLFFGAYTAPAWILGNFANTCPRFQHFLNQWHTLACANKRNIAGSRPNALQKFRKDYQLML